MPATIGVDTFIRILCCRDREDGGRDAPHGHHSHPDLMRSMQRGQQNWFPEEHLSLGFVLDSDSCSIYKYEKSL